MKITVTSHVFAVLVLVFSVFANDAWAQAIRVGGTGAPLAALRQLGDAFVAQHPDAAVDVLPSMGSSGGLRALNDGAIDLAISARPPRADESDGAELAVFPFVATPLVVVTSYDGDVDMRMDDVVAMFADRAATWPDGSPVRAILRPETESDVRILIEAIPGLEAAFAAARQRPEVPVAANDQQNMDLAATTAGSLAMGTLLQVRSEGLPLHVLPIDGLARDAADQHPASKQFFLVAHADAPDRVRDFVAFARSDAGSAIMRRLGATPTR